LYFGLMSFGGPSNCALTIRPQGPKVPSTKICPAVAFLVTFQV
jgi:hypothetical protein